MSNFIPNSFQIPNSIVDELLVKMSGNALKCYMLITRKTTGWCKSIDKISISQFMKLSGIKDKRTVYTALDELLSLGLIKSDKNNGSITEFSLVNSLHEPVAKNAGTKNATGSKKCTEPVTKNATGTSDKKCHPTKDTIKNNITKEKINKKDLDLSLFSQKPNEKVWTDYLEHRKNKKAKLTQTALNRLAEEINKANDLGWSTDDVLATCMLRNWQGFEVRWMLKDQKINTEKINQVSTQRSNPAGFVVVN